MHALTVCQPWAGLMVGSFLKSHWLIRRAEIRKWATAYRGPLLIHAGLDIDRSAEKSFGIQVPKEETGCIIGCVTLDDVKHIQNERMWNSLWDEHLELGKRCYGDNTYLWSLSTPVLFAKPIPCGGKLGLWIPDADTVNKLDWEDVPCVAYKVLREDLLSLGLSGAPHMQYKAGVWNALCEPISVSGHAGGLWVAPTIATARAQQRYMLKKHGMKTRLFRCIIGKRLQKTSCRIKTDRLFFEPSDEIL